MTTMTLSEFKTKYLSTTTKEFAKEIGCSAIWLAKIAAKHNIKKRSSFINIIEG